MDLHMSNGKTKRAAWDIFWWKEALRVHDDGHLHCVIIGCEAPTIALRRRRACYRQFVFFLVAERPKRLASRNSHHSARVYNSRRYTPFCCKGPQHVSNCSRRHEGRIAAINMGTPLVVCDGYPLHRWCAGSKQALHADPRG